MDVTEPTEVVGRVENATLDGLNDLSVDDLYQHIDALADERPGPADLYRRWERQQWAAGDLDFGVDLQHWRSFDPLTRASFEEFFAGFLVGEQVVTDTLPPLMMGAPDEDSRLFLATQIVDEARHTYFFARFFNEVIGVGGGVQGAVDLARGLTRTEPFIQVFDKDLVSLTDAVRLDPSDYGAWVEALTLYHMMVEGILALVGQKQILTLLRAYQILPAFRSGFTAVTRDESRHVNYGVWALRQAIERGYGSSIRVSVERSLESCLRVYANPDYKIVIPSRVTPEMRPMFDYRRRWQFGVDSLVKRLRVAGEDDDYLTKLQHLGASYIQTAIDDYEEHWGEEHPVRLFERGEIG